MLDFPIEVTAYTHYKLDVVITQRWESNTSAHLFELFQKNGFHLDEFRRHQKPKRNEQNMHAETSGFHWLGE